MKGKKPKEKEINERKKERKETKKKIRSEGDGN